MSPVLIWITYASWFGAAVCLVRGRREIARTVRAMPVRWRLFVLVLLAACALIPGPVDDLIVAGLIARIGRRQQDV